MIGITYSRITLIMVGIWIVGEVKSHNDQPINDCYSILMASKKRFVMERDAENHHWVIPRSSDFKPSQPQP